MQPIYNNLSEAKRDAAQAFAAERGLAFETGPDEEEGTFYVLLLAGDEGAPSWTGQAITDLETLLAE
jgi:hypothetical protein